MSPVTAPIGSVTDFYQKSDERCPPSMLPSTHWTALPEKSEIIVGSGQYHLAVAGGCAAVSRLKLSLTRLKAAHPPATARWY